MNVTGLLHRLQVKIENIDLFKILIKNMKTSLKAGFAQIFSCCPKNLSCPKFGGAAAPLAPPPTPGPYAYVRISQAFIILLVLVVGIVRKTLPAGGAFANFSKSS